MYILEQFLSNIQSFNFVVEKKMFNFFSYLHNNSSYRKIPLNVSALICMLLQFIDRIILLYFTTFVIILQNTKNVMKNVFFQIVYLPTYFELIHLASTSLPVFTIKQNFTKNISFVHTRNSNCIIKGETNLILTFLILLTSPSQNSC